MNEHAIIVGAQRSGTTYLYKILEQHPEICVAKPSFPEPKYFLRPVREIDYQEYFEKYFHSCKNDKKVFLEKSTNYYENKKAAINISRSISNVKLLFILRDPVDRALSNYFFTRKHGLETRTLNEVFLENCPAPEYDTTKISVNPFDYYNRGNYVNFLENYQKIIPLRNIKIIIFEEFINNYAQIQKVFSFLNIDKTFYPAALNEKINFNENKTDIPIKVIESLSAYYKSYNLKLKKVINQPLDLWK